MNYITALIVIKVIAILSGVIYTKSIHKINIASILKFISHLIFKYQVIVIKSVELCY